MFQPAADQSSTKDKYKAHQYSSHRTKHNETTVHWKMI